MPLWYISHANIRKHTILFKSRVFAAFRDRIGYVEEKPKQKSVVWKVESYTRMCWLILEEIQKDPELMEMSRSRLDDDCYQDEAYHLLTADIVFFGSVYMSEEEFKGGDRETPAADACPDSGKEAATDVGLNTILYGPPGTGKTYHTVIYAVAVIENKELAQVEQEAKNNYPAVLGRYRWYREQGRIEFTTFHQSYGYEEFIEGIRPVVASPDGTEGGIRRRSSTVWSLACLRDSVKRPSVQALQERRILALTSIPASGRYPCGEPAITRSAQSAWNTAISVSGGTDMERILRMKQTLPMAAVQF